MDGEVCTDVYVTKFLANSREPIVIETKTITTTTTVTKRICISKDANVDLTDIQSLLDNRDNQKLNSIETYNDTSEEPLTPDIINSIKNTTNGKENKSIFSSTLIGSDDKLVLNGVKNEISDTNYFESKTKNKTGKKDDKTMAKKRSRSKTTNTDATDKSSYIDGLINQYMTLEKKSSKTTSNKVEQEKKETNEPKASLSKIVEVEPKDLSAILETSIEGNASPVRSRLRSNSSIDFDGLTNSDYYVEPADYLPESTKVNKLLMADKENKNSKKTKDSMKSLKYNEPSKQKQSPIKIYSPSTKGKFRKSGSDKLILTKKMIQKKLENYPSSSKDVLERFGHSANMVVESDSRLLIYNPAKSDESEKEACEDTDILLLVKKKSKPLLVKET